MREITLQGMRFHALVGILPHERVTPQPIEIDLRVQVEAGDSVVDYRRLYDIAAAIVAAGPIDYLEDVAELIATGALTYGAQVRTARVAVRKPHVALPGPLAYAEVAVERHASA